MLRTTSFSALGQEQGIHQYIPPHLKNMFYKNPARVHAAHNGLDPYGFPTRGLVAYLPLWAQKDAAFKSVDAYKHTVTVSGALWYPNSRWFDGGGAADDSITVTDATSITDHWDGGGSVSFWLNPASDGEANVAMYVRKGSGWQILVESEVGGKVEVRFICDFDDTDGQWVTTATELTINTWELVTLTYNSSHVDNNPIMYIGTTAKTVGAGLTETTPVGTRVSNSGSDMFVGNNAAAGIRTWDGYIGEGWIYNRILAAGEVADIKSRTSWRYQ